jgi:hypothetical protein
MIVSLTAFERPRYLRETLAHFAAAASSLEEPTVVLAQVEPSDKLDEVLALLAPYPNIYVRVNEERLGLQANTLAALDWAWGVAAVSGDGFVLHLEDDLLIAHDGLRLAAWLRDTYRDDADAQFVSLTNCGSTRAKLYDRSVPPPSDWNRVWRTDWFECHVWGTWTPEWERLRSVWPHERRDHWAARVTEGELTGHQVLPVLSRSKSIGIVGQHCEPHAHEEHNPLVWADDLGFRVRGGYEECPHDSAYRRL